MNLVRLTQSVHEAAEATREGELTPGNPVEVVTVILTEPVIGIGIESAASISV